MHLLGKNVGETLHAVAAYPSLRTRREWLKNYCEKVHGFDYRDLKLDGSEQFLRLVQRKFFPEVSPENRKQFVLASDAMYVSVRWEVSKDPRRSEAMASSDLTPTKVTDKAVEGALQSPGKFDELMRQRTMAQAVFATILMPVDGKGRAVPVLVQPSVSGAAVFEVRAPIDNVADRLTELGFDDEGRAHDGDRTFYYKLVTQGEAIKSRFEELVASGEAMVVPVTGMFKAMVEKCLRDHYDLWHTEKNTKSAIVRSGDGEDGLLLIPDMGVLSTQICSSVQGCCLTPSGMILTGRCLMGWFGSLSGIRCCTVDSSRRIGSSCSGC
jgi:hypothetical protein